MAKPTQFPAVSFEISGWIANNAGQTRPMFGQKSPSLEIQIPLTVGEWITREVQIAAGDVTPQTLSLWDVSGTQTPADLQDDFLVMMLRSVSGGDIDVGLRNKSGGFDEFSSVTLDSSGLPVLLASDRASVVYDAGGVWNSGTPTFGTIQRIEVFNDTSAVKIVELSLGR